jgi:hypothetical protein
MNLYYKWKNYITYKKILKKNKKELKENFNLEIDWVNRIWSVIKLPNNLSEDANKYGYLFTEKEVEKYIKRLDKYFTKIGIFELIELEDLVLLNPVEVGITFKYKFLNTKKIFLFKLFGTLLLILIGIYLIFFI